MINVYQLLNILLPLIVALKDRYCQKSLYLCSQRDVFHNWRLSHIIVVSSHNIWEVTERLFTTKSCHNLLWPESTTFKSQIDVIYNWKPPQFIVARVYNILIVSRIIENTSCRCHQIVLAAYVPNNSFMTTIFVVYNLLHFNINKYLSLNLIFGPFWDITGRMSSFWVSFNSQGHNMFYKYSITKSYVNMHINNCSHISFHFY